MKKKLVRLFKLVKLNESLNHNKNNNKIIGQMNVGKENNFWVCVYVCVFVWRVIYMNLQLDKTKQKKSKENKLGHRQNETLKNKKLS